MAMAMAEAAVGSDTTMEETIGFVGGGKRTEDEFGEP